MKKILCSIYDSKAESWLPPSAFISRGQAIRTFDDIVNGRNGDNDMARHPEDFSIHTIGEFDQSLGVITPNTPTILEQGINLKQIGEPHS